MQALVRFLVFSFLSISVYSLHKCIHSQLSGEIQIYNDTSSRTLQSLSSRQMIIHIDQENLQKTRQIYQVISKVNQVSQNFFHNLLSVPETPKLYYPNSQPCNKMQVPIQYLEEGIQADYVFMVGVIYSDYPYLASCTACAKLNSTRRPYFGGILWNLKQINPKVDKGLDSLEFQTLVYVSIHQMMHGLAFSSVLFGDFADLSKNFDNENNNSNPFITNPYIKKIVQKYFNCNEDIDLGLQDSDKPNTYSHWDEQFLGEEIMTPVIDGYVHISEFTIEIFVASGWYTSVSRQYIEPSNWGKNKGCQFIRNRQNCQFQEFCQETNENEINCGYDHVAKGKCNKQRYSNCGIVTPVKPESRCYSNNFISNNNAEERKGASSKCFQSNLMRTGVPRSRDKGRCYTATCLSSKTKIIISIDDSFYICKDTEERISPIRGFDGFLQCPKSFERICQAKQFCSFHCNKLGICINGKCLCKGSDKLTNTCQTTRRLEQIIQEREVQARNSMICPPKTIFDPITRQCHSCSELLSCAQCNMNGCIMCDDASVPIDGKCN